MIHYLYHLDQTHRNKRHRTQCFLPFIGVNRQACDLPAFKLNDAYRDTDDHETFYNATSTVTGFSYRQIRQSNARIT